MIHLAVWIAAFLFLCLVALAVVNVFASVIASISVAAYWRKHHEEKEASAKTPRISGTSIRVVSVTPKGPSAYVWVREAGVSVGQFHFL
jgi:hypothetical protein